ncbi:MAG: hypothetical protein EI684_13565, partial [Candidatus Viridilinea halotolerans]
MKTEVFSVLDLFCGAGGMSLGFKRVGFEIIGAIDNNEAAIKTYKSNLGFHISNQDLFHATELQAATVIIGGPPCQGFSSAGLRQSIVLQIKNPTKPPGRRRP